VFNTWRLEETKPLKQRETLAVRLRIYIYSCYATFDRGLAQAEKVGVRGVGLIKFVCVPGEHSAFIKKTQKNDSKQNEMEDKKKKENRNLN
jgi:cobalamin biosynthesis Co2+ chelatase CbiK